MAATLECPISLPEKEWLENRMAWLGDVFGRDEMVNAKVILPTEEFFPHQFNGSEGDARVLLDAVCGFMGAAPENVELAFFEDRLPFAHGAAGVYEQGLSRDRIWIE